MNPQQTFIGHCELKLATESQKLTTAHNGLFRIDPRVNGNKLVDSQFKQYATKNDFSAAATTESGKLAVASNKGDIRLFDSIGKNAKVSSLWVSRRPQADFRPLCQLWVTPSSA